jgi:hypothetical protein
MHHYKITVCCKFCLKLQIGLMVKQRTVIAVAETLCGNPMLTPHKSKSTVLRLLHDIVEKDKKTFEVSLFFLDFTLGVMDKDW